MWKQGKNVYCVSLCTTLPYVFLSPSNNLNWYIKIRKGRLILFWVSGRKRTANDNFFNPESCAARYHGNGSIAYNKHFSMGGNTSFIKGDISPSSYLTWEREREREREREKWLRVRKREEENGQARCSVREGKKHWGASFSRFTRDFG